MDSPFRRATDASTQRREIRRCEAIEVPLHSNLWARLSAGELNVKDLEGDKNLEVLAGRIQIDIPHPELYGHRDVSVATGSTGLNYPVEDG